MSRFPVMAKVLGFTSVHNAVGTKRLLAARDELQANEAAFDQLEEARTELEEARAWIADRGMPYEWDEDDPPTVTDALKQVFHWGDSAWDVAGKAEERQVQLKNALATVGGLVDLENDIAGALRLIHDTIGWSPQNRTERALSDVRMERARQERLREEGRFDHTLADPHWDEGEKLAALAEETGEVGKALLHKRGVVADGGGSLRDELIHVAAVAVAWVEALDYEASEQDRFCRCANGPHGGTSYCYLCRKPAGTVAGYPHA